MPELSKQELKHVTEAFAQFDENHDGTISTSELKHALNQMGFKPSDKQVKQMVQSVDIEGTGTIDFEEFKTLTQTSMYLKSATIFTVDQIHQIRSIFDSFDTRGDGELSRDDLEAAMKKLGQKPTRVQMEEMMATVDHDNRGSVDFMEFLDMMSNSEKMKLATTHKVKRHGGMVDILIKYNNDKLGLADITDDGSSSYNGADIEDEEGRCTSNIKTLALTAFLFALITALQTIGALFVGSKALMADCVSMGVDSCTYVANIFVECQKGTRCYKPSELIVGSISLAILSYLTWDVMAEAIETLRSPDDGEENQDNPWMPWIVLFFAVLGLIFDSCSLYSFYHESKESGQSANMFTALLHVGADFLRSGTTFISSLLMFAGVDSAMVDSVAAIILGITILGGAAFAAWELLVEARQYLCPGSGKDSVRDVEAEKLMAERATGA